MTTRRPKQHLDQFAVLLATHIRDNKVGEALVDVDGQGQIARAFGFAL